ncbi:MAG: HD domain-containing protein [Patescibacteria group bacterium]
MYSLEEKKIILHTSHKVESLFKNYPVPAHGIKHIKHVVEYTKQIAKKEKTNIFLAEMSAWLHDIGRTLEIDDSFHGNKHHELSYELCQKWFQEDKIYNKLNRKQKEILLYSVRYHWNNVADKYDTAWILRDADKLDSLGKNGIERMLEFSEKDESKLELNLRLRYDIFYWLKTKTAKKIVKDKKMMEQIDKFYFKLLKKEIKPIKIKK